MRFLRGMVGFYAWLLEDLLYEARAVARSHHHTSQTRSRR